MAFEIRGLNVVSGSTQVHKFYDTSNTVNQGVDFNMNAGAGAFGVSGSFLAGRADQNRLTDGAFLHGLLQIPTYNPTIDNTQLEALAGSGLDDGTYNGCMFYLNSLGGSGYNGDNARALSLFKRGDCLYFCRKGNWYHGGFQPKLPMLPVRFLRFMDAQVLEQFEFAGSWGHAIDIADLSGFSSFGSTTNDDTLTFEHGQGFVETVSISNLSGFSNFSATTNTDTLDAATGADLGSFSDFADGHTTSMLETYEHGQGYLGTNTSLAPTPNWDSGPDGDFTSTFEHGQGYVGTFTSIEPTPDWDSSPDGNFTEGYEGW